jgi:hypothetical protein
LGYEFYADVESSRVFERRERKHKAILEEMKQMNIKDRKEDSDSVSEEDSDSEVDSEEEEDA